MDQMYELEHILCMFTQNNMDMDESIHVASIVDKLLSTWKDVKKNLKHRKDDLSLKDLPKHLLIEEPYRLENKTNDDTSMVHVVEEKRESSKGSGKKRTHDDKDKKKSKKEQKGCHLLQLQKAETFQPRMPEILVGGLWCHPTRVQRPDMVKTYEPSDSMLYMGNHSTAQVKGKGKIDFVFTSGNTLTFKNVLLVPYVCGKFVGKGYHTGGMFKLNIKDVVNSSVNDVNMTEISDANDASAGEFSLSLKQFRPHRSSEQSYFGLPMNCLPRYNEATYVAR
uniref:Retrovirus-related Pol polyprotein from transposon TNT 1-94-like beta-barrel domain-containing protein n=1 Tax=Tanacetum cinerariifolium TaxID=118510 RepID=A0A699HCF8_TANCI|nr:hypothetical protein [Tanacetum cinerariifolium]